MSRPLPIVGLALAFSIPTLSAPPRAQARPKIVRPTRARLEARCKIHVIHGLNVPGPFPRALRHLRSHLVAQPFKAFLSFKLLKVVPLRIREGKVAGKELVGPYRLEILLREQLLTARGKRRLRFTLSLHRRRSRFRAARRMLRSRLVLDRGGTLFLAGPRHQTGRLVIGVTCR